MGANLILPVKDVAYTPTAAGGYLNRELPASPGTVHWNADRSKAYRLCQADFAVVAGDLVCFSTAGDSDRYSVSPDNGGATCILTLPAGLALVAAAVDDYFWVQCYGMNDIAVVTDGSIAQGEHVIPHATTNGGLDTAAGTEATAAVAGTALQADTGTVLAVGELLVACPTDSVDAIS